MLEAGSRAGGVVLSEQVDGFTIDAGPDSLLVQKPEGIRLCEELGLGDRLVPTKPPRLAFIQRGGRLHPLPAASVLGIPTRVGPVRSHAALLVARQAAHGRGARHRAAHATASDESIGAFMTRRFGAEATTYLAEPLLAGIHAGDVDRLSVGALFPRFVEAERTHGSLLRAFRKEAMSRARPPADGDAGGVFRSLPGGLSDIVDALVRDLPAASIRLRTPASSVAHDGAGYLVSTDSRISRRRSRGPRDAGLRDRPHRPLVESGSRELCDEVPYASTATVVLAFPRDAVAHPLNGSGFVVPRAERTGILAASWLSSKWPDRAPDDRVLMRTFVGGARDPRRLRTLRRRARRGLAARRSGRCSGIRGEPLFTRVYRWERASAQHEVGHLGRLARIERRARPPSRAVRHRQRLPRRRYPGLRRRRPRHGPNDRRWLNRN